MTLEQHLTKLIKANSSADFFNVIAHELWNDGSGWSTNSSWFLETQVNLEYAVLAIKQRWEIFKVNYHPTAKVKDITISGEGELYLEVDHIPFINLRPQ